MPPSPVSSLADSLARKRILYPSPLITAPSVLVIDVPPVNRGRGLALGRYHAMIIESEVERLEVDYFLAEERMIPRLPNILDHRPSNLWSDRVLISRYEPPEMGWPWLSVTRWPDDFRDAAVGTGITLARGCYTMELFETADEVDAHHIEMLDGLSAHHAISVRMLSADRIPSEGLA